MARAWFHIFEGLENQRHLLDPQSVRRVRYKAPAWSTLDREEIEDGFEDGTLFPNIQRQHARNRLKRNILSLRCVIPSILTFDENMRYLTITVKILERCIEVKPKRGRKRGADDLTLGKRAPEDLFENLSKDWNCDRSFCETAEGQFCEVKTQPLPEFAFIQLCLRAWRMFPHLGPVAPLQDIKGVGMTAYLDDEEEARLCNTACILGYNNSKIRARINPDIATKPKRTKSKKAKTSSWRGGKPTIRTFRLLKKTSFYPQLLQQYKAREDPEPVCIQADIVRAFFGNGPVDLDGGGLDLDETKPPFGYETLRNRPAERRQGKTPGSKGRANREDRKRRRREKRLRTRRSGASDEPVSPSAVDDVTMEETSPNYEDTTRIDQIKPSDSHKRKERKEKEKEKAKKEKAKKEKEKRNRRRKNIKLRARHSETSHESIAVVEDLSPNLEDIDDSPSPSDPGALVHFDPGLPPQLSRRSEPPDPLSNNITSQPSHSLSPSSSISPSPEADFAQDQLQLSVARFNPDLPPHLPYRSWPQSPPPHFPFEVSGTTDFLPLLVTQRSDISFPSSTHQSQNYTPPVDEYQPTYSLPPVNESTHIRPVPIDQRSDPSVLSSGIQQDPGAPLGENQSMYGQPGESTEIPPLPIDQRSDLSSQSSARRQNFTPLVDEHQPTDIPPISVNRRLEPSFPSSTFQRQDYPASINENQTMHGLPIDDSAVLTTRSMAEGPGSNLILQGGQNTSPVGTPEVSPKRPRSAIESDWEMRFVEMYHHKGSKRQRLDDLSDRDESESQSFRGDPDVTVPSNNDLPNRGPDSARTPPEWMYELP